MSDNKNNFFSYKGFPLIRCKNEIYYGNMYDEYVIWIQILKTEKVGDVETATKLKIFRLATDDSLPANEKITKTAEKDSLYEALDIAHIWLSRYV